MSQTTTGIKSVLSYPTIYRFVQNIVGARKFARIFVNEYLKPARGQRILDIGCGTGDVVEHLPPVDYWGYDVSPEYIQEAQRHFGDKARFLCEDVNNINIGNMPKFDVVVAMLLLHHLNDEEALKLFSFAKKLSKDNGKVLTIDPCLVDGLDSPVLQDI